MHSTWVVVLFVILASSRPAHAEDPHVAAIRTLLGAQTKAWRNSDDKAFAALLAPGALIDTNDYPRTDYVMQPPYGIRKFAISASKIGWAGTWGWVAAEIKLTSQRYAEPAGMGDPNPKPENETYHWIAMVVADGAAVKTKALVVRKAIPDNYLVEYDVVQNLLPVASPPALVAVLQQPSVLASKLSSDPSTAALGSSPGEFALGPADAKKLAGRWAKLALQVVDTPDKDSKVSYKPIELVIGDGAFVWAKVRMKLPGAKRWIELAGFAIARRLGDGWELVVLGYG